MVCDREYSRQPHAVGDQADAGLLSTMHADVVDALDDLAEPGMVGRLAAADQLEGACSVGVRHLEKRDETVWIDRA